MGTTYLGLINKVLIRLNETTLTETTFNGTLRGVHAAVREAVTDSIAKIQNHLFQMNISAGEHRMTLVPGITEYPWPNGFKSADWNSFYIEHSPTYNVGNSPLRKVNRDQWYGIEKDTDDNQVIGGRGVPRMVFESHGHGFGISPAPNEEYTIVFRYYFNETPLTNANDECSIPSQFDYVIVNGAIYFMKLFKSDVEQADRMDQIFKSGLSDMRNLLSNRRDSLVDTRVQRSIRGFF